MYLPSFYKLKFEKYTFNSRIWGSFAIPGALWGTPTLTQRSGSSTPRSTTASTPTSSPPHAESPAESSRTSEPPDSLINRNDERYQLSHYDIPPFHISI